MNDLIDYSRLADAVAQQAMLPRWLSIKVASRYCSLSETALRRLVAAGKITARKPLPGKIVIDRIELDDYLSKAK